jgi:hypothetical protein
VQSLQPDTPYAFVLAVDDCVIYVGAAIAQLFRRAQHGFTVQRCAFGNDEIAFRVPKNGGFIRNPLNPEELISTLHQPRRAAWATMLHATSARTERVVKQRGWVCEY